MSGNSGFLFDNEPNLGAADPGRVVTIMVSEPGLKSMWDPVCYVPMWLRSG